MLKKKKQPNFVTTLSNSNYLQEKYPLDLTEKKSINQLDKIIT